MADEKTVLSKRLALKFGTKSFSVSDVKTTATEEQLYNFALVVESDMDTGSFMFDMNLTEVKVITETQLEMY